MKKIHLLTISILLASCLTYAQSTPPSGVAETASWFAGIGGERKGPFTAAQIKSQITDGIIDSKTLIWKEGMSDWQEAGSNALFSPAFAEADQTKPAVAPSMTPTESQTPAARSGKSLWLEIAENPEHVIGSPEMIKALKNASKEVMPPEEITLQKLEEIFQSASFATKNETAGGPFTVLLGPNFEIGVAMYPVPNTINFTAQFPIKPNVPELDRLRLANTINYKGGGLYMADIELQNGSNIRVARTNFYDQGISEWHILAKFSFFVEILGDAINQADTDEILE